MTDLNPKMQDEAQKTLQEIADRMLPEYAGAEVEDSRQALVRAIAAAGLPEQPQKWVTDTAAEISAGRRAIIDRTIQDEDDPRRAG